MDLLEKVGNELNKINCESELCSECKRNHLNTCMRDMYNYLEGLSTAPTKVAPSVGSIVRITNTGKVYSTYYGMFDIMNIKPSLAARYTSHVNQYEKYKVIAIAAHEDTNEPVLCLKAIDFDEVLLIGPDGMRVID